MFEYVSSFILEESTFFPEGSHGRELAGDLVKVSAALTLADSRQRDVLTSRRRATEAKMRMCGELKQRLQLMIDIARLVERTAPGISDRFKWPRNDSDAAFLQTARSFVEHATPIADTFIKYAMPADFINYLNQRIQKIEQQLTERTSERTVLKGATRDISAEIKKGMEIVRELDIITANVLGNDAIKLGNWRTRRNLPKPRRRTKAAAAGVSSAPSTGSDSTP